MKRIHIVGSGPRTGTTLLAEVMHTCFQIDHHCAHEAPISTERPGFGSIFLTKQPGDILSVKWPLLLDSSLYVICIVRDPRDTICSRHGSDPSKYWTGLRYWRPFCEQLGSLRNHPRFLLIRYEELVSDPDRTQDRIQQAFPFLVEDGKFTEYHKLATPSVASLNALRGVRPIAPVGIGVWKMHLGRVKNQLAVHGDISSDLVSLGYEADTKWLNELHEAEEDRIGSVRPEFLTWRDSFKHLRREWREVANILLRSIGFRPKIVFLPLDLFADKSRRILKAIRWG